MPLSGATGPVVRLEQTIREHQGGEREMVTTDLPRPAIDERLAPMNLSVVDLTVSPAGRRKVVRVVLDRDLSRLPPDDTTSLVAPVSLDEIAAATRAVSDALEADDLLGEQPYVLEVTSPGVGRPLRTWEQFRRNVGRLVNLVTSDGEELSGRILSVSADTVELAIPGSRKRPDSRRTVPLGEVGSAVVQVEFARAGDDRCNPDVGEADEAKESS